jgi:hypothetical protein
MNTLGKLFAIGAIVVTAVTVLIFLGLHSLTTFQYVFFSQPVYAWLGFGLTSGAFIAYAAKLKWWTDTLLAKAVSIIMIALTFGGELVTAGFGLKLESYKAAGIVFTEQDVKSMILAVQALGFIHGLALIADFLGPEIIKAFQYRGSLTDPIEPIPAETVPLFSQKEQAIETPELKATPPPSQ